MVSFDKLPLPCDCQLFIECKNNQIWRRYIWTIISNSSFQLWIIWRTLGESVKSIGWVRGTRVETSWQQEKNHAGKSPVRSVVSLHVKESHVAEIYLRSATVLSLSPCGALGHSNPAHYTMQVMAKLVFLWISHTTVKELLLQFLWLVHSGVVKVCCNTRQLLLK